MRADRIEHILHRAQISESFEIDSNFRCVYTYTRINIIHGKIMKTIYSENDDNCLVQSILLKFTN
jgi:hypothetical protein